MGTTRSRRVQSQLAFALAIMLALVGIAGTVRAVAQEPAAAGVSVGCSPSSVDGTTSCTFSASGVDQLIVPYEAICGTVLSSSGVAGANGYESAVGSSVVSVVLANTAAAGGGATYTVVSGGTASSLGGLAVVCIDSTVPPSSDESTTEPDFGGAVDEATEPSEETVPASDVSGTPEATEVVETDDSVATPEATEAPDDSVEPANVVVDPSTTPEPSATLGASVTITVLSYLCATDPGAADPAGAGCSLASGVPYTATDVDGVEGPTQTVSGTATFTSNIGSSLVVKQGTAAALTGYVPRGDGTLEVQSLTGNTTLTFVNIIKAELGRLQIVG
ncbi:MAG: hypothetical protein ACRDHN_08710, partial [Thermomicrobiales bacterium]